MNPLDVIAVLLVVLAVLLGFRSGALPQVGGLLGAIGGGALVITALPALTDIQSPDIDLSDLADLEGTLQLMQEASVL